MLHRGSAEVDVVSNPMALVAGPASGALGARVADCLQLEPIAYGQECFPDGEIQFDLHSSVRGRDLYLLQATNPPVERHLMELLLLADACRRAGADRLTGIIPYFGYARQDRRISRRSLGARVAADVISTAHFDRLMLVDAHTPSIEGFFDMPIDHLTAVPMLAAAAKSSVGDSTVVVAPDLGAVKRAREFARLLRLPMAAVYKMRTDGAEVETHGVMGEVRGRIPFIIDDMLSTGATIDAAIAALRDAGGHGPATVAVTHALFVADAQDRLRRLPIARLIVTDTVPLAHEPQQHLDVTSVAPLLAAAIRRNHADESLADLRASA